MPRQRHANLKGMEDYLTVAQAAQRIGIEPGAVRDAIARKRLAAVRIGGKGIRAGILLIKPEEVQRYIDEIRGKMGPKPRKSPPAPPLEGNAR